MDIDRRTLLGSAVATVLTAVSGCAGLGTDEPATTATTTTQSDETPRSEMARGATGVYLHNLDEEQHSISVSITAVDEGILDQPRLASTVELATAETKDFDTKAVWDIKYEISVNVSDEYSETAIWTANPGSLHILYTGDDITRNNIIFADGFA
ncbi:Twin arginine translocation signal domain containing protein [Halorhabdus tiamatea SARL4B]|uniref:Twin arginine translocation signal domain containing protein n=1 Tax=Halorhabdus tiamatea SARL4B TaxID=1033806 RepID=F7PLH3_9EURY|nr:hypothetical protein [Halorhabdus tiamatea]ERJ05473.1 Twin arginine translocation signal domain containing protein [Halorhabdus tiamatea SARL4B]